MASLKSLVKNSSLKTNLFDQFIAQKVSPKFIHYDEELDELFVLLIERTIPTVAHPLNEFVSLLFEPGSMEVVGVEVEEFQREFVKRFSTVEKVWQVDDCPENLGDLQKIMRGKEPLMAREVALVAEKMLGRRGKSYSLIPA